MTERRAASARVPRKPTRGQVAAARLLVKREKEGKATVPVSSRIKELADSAPDR
ncbi:RNA helicase [Corynebacterium sp. NPDC060344]|uniref:RNA helicase n=1 Tax=Corynebacterium sp. NPDC060344 TaxID=3347101 RepID=UPI00364C4312